MRISSWIEIRSFRSEINPGVYMNTLQVNLDSLRLLIRSIIGPKRLLLWRFRSLPVYSYEDSDFEAYPSDICLKLFFHLCSISTWYAWNCRYVCDQVCWKRQVLVCSYIGLSSIDERCRQANFTLIALVFDEKQHFLANLEESNEKSASQLILKDFFLNSHKLVAPPF